MKKIFYAFILILLCFPMAAQNFVPIQADLEMTPSPDIDYLKEGVFAYQNNNFQQALDYFLIVENNGLKNPTLYFNIGNAYYRNNQIANAIIYYKKALLLDSSFKPAQNNLEFMLSITQDKQTDLEEHAMTKFVVNHYYFFSINTLMVICFILLFVIIVLIHIQWFFRDKDNTAIRFINFIVLFIFICCSGITISRIYIANNNNEAVVTDGTVYVYSGPSESFTRLFTLHEGTVLKIQKEELNWTQVSTLSGFSGWIDAGTYRKIRE